MASVCDILSALQACWCEQLSCSLGGSPLTCCITPGNPAFPETGCGGFAWVRLVGAYPSVNFPQHASQPQKCIIDTWALQVEVGITRCAPQPCEVLGDACCDQQADASAILADDFAQMRKLFICGCLGLASDEIIMGSMTVYGPEGGLVGVKMQATLRSD